MAQLNAGALYYGPRNRAKPAEWSIENFKSIEYASLPLSNLVVLTGANSSGKSSLIQSLLLLAQSSDDEIILNGPLVRLGDPIDVIRSGTDSLTLSYTLVSPTTNQRASSEWAFSIRLVAGAQTLEIADFDAAVDGEQVLSATSSRVTAVAKAEVNPEHRFGNTILRVKEISGHAAPSRTYLSFQGLYPEALIVRQKRDIVLRALKRTYNSRAISQDSERLFQLYEELQPWWRSHEDSLPTDIVELYNSLFLRGSPRQRVADPHQMATLNSLFELFADAAEEEGWQPIPVSRYGAISTRGTLVGRSPSGTSQDIKYALVGLGVAEDGLKRIRESVRYLGPLREEPQVVSASGARNRNLPTGTKGEYTADLLARELNKVVTFYDWNRRRQQMSLPAAISLWTEYLGVGDAVAVEDQGKLGRGLRLEVNGISRDLTTVGVGASQLLPVLAVVLAADRDTVVCIEQPELHLHPAVQSRLADFFLFARPGVRVIIETHSEYMITRIRLRVAEDKVRPANVAVFFSEQAKGVTNLRKLELNSMGDFSSWPKGFFDTQNQDARELVKAVTARYQKKES
ncbi:AAA family ATPase [Clavibacter michiganensis]|uniref:AAA family ATPase n=1 Tax=Clavibacter michiganensis TaxID=28447 RepID=UPI001056616B|nr:DUF3696 domain-containing protein [Clavibacter michiganensis]